MPGDPMPEIDALTDEERIEFLSYIEKQTKGPTAAVLNIALLYDIEVLLEQVLHDLKLSTSVEGRQVDKLVEAYRGGREDVIGEPAGIRGGTIDTDDTESDDEEGESGGLGEAGGVGLSDV